MAEKKEVEVPNYLQEVLVFLALLFLLTLFAWRFSDFLYIWGLGGWSGLWERIAVFFTYTIWPTFKVVGFFITVFCAVLLTYTIWKFRALIKEERAIYNPIRSAGPADKAEARIMNSKWERIVEHINSANASDWRLAIIEADIMLEEILRDQGYHGSTIGDMLKAVEKSDMLTLEYAWEAHKTRNRIAHSGSEFALNEREAKHTIALYESIFKEFKII